MTDNQKDLIFDAYLECALWSSTDYNGDPLDDNYGNDDIALDQIKPLRDEVCDFIDGNAALLDASGLSPDQIGYDFWLTRNGHGAGFWDRGLGDIGRKLADAAQVYGSVDLYVGDDGKLYFS